jgi:hypothetical protein
MRPPHSLHWLRPALRAFTSLGDVSLRRNRSPRLSLPPRGAEPAPSERLRAREWLARTGGHTGPLAQSAWERPCAD